jgi:hypothetical protein
VEFFIPIGLIIVLIPTRLMLKLDRRTGYALYKSSPNEKTGLRRAALFYKLFGLAFVAIGLLSNPRWMNEFELFLSKF